MAENITHELNEKVSKLTSGSNPAQRIVAKFAHEKNAVYFGKLLQNKGYHVQIFKNIGHAQTVENLKTKLAHHFAVHGNKSGVGGVLGKFL